MAKKIQLQLDHRINLKEYLTQNYPWVQDYRILSQSLDARGASRGRAPIFLYQVEVLAAGENFQQRDALTAESFAPLGPFQQPPIIIGAGPAGLFCALRLAEYGVPSIILERGAPASERMRFIARFWRYGELDVNSNVCYGEGGAGLFSDGKLITRIKSPYISYCMRKFVDFGAPPETAYLKDPHLGSNKIRKIIGQISGYLREKGHSIHYNTIVQELLVENKNGQKQVVGVRTQDGRCFYSPYVILATGHSAQEMYHHLQDLKVQMAPKSFAIGVRIEHPRTVIDRLQYGPYAAAEMLGTARYRLSFHDPQTQRGTYSFCMCPGGYVLSSGTDKDGLVVNGMSNYSRHSPWSNSALVVTVEPGRDFDTSQILGGLNYQRSIEFKAHQLSRQQATGREIPAITVQEFLSDNLNANSKLPISSCPSGTFKTSFAEIFPPTILQHMRQGLQEFEQQLQGFSTSEALLLAPETRTSAPVTLERHKQTLESLSHQGLYPCGEGAGHAGGITSAAVDGVRVAMSILQKEKNFNPS